VRQGEYSLPRLMPQLEKRNRVTSLWSAITRTNAFGFDVDRFLKEGLKESGRRGSNPRRQAWEACILPLNYSRLRRRSVYIKRRGPTYRMSAFLSRQKRGPSFTGIVHAQQVDVSIGQCVVDLELIAKASDSDDWINRIEYLPLK
jgi:hypothetical protein